MYFPPLKRTFPCKLLCDPRLLDLVLMLMFIFQFHPYRVDAFLPYADSFGVGRYGPYEFIKIVVRHGPEFFLIAVFKAGEPQR